MMSSCAMWPTRVQLCDVQLCHVAYQGSVMMSRGLDTTRTHRPYL